MNSGDYYDRHQRSYPNPATTRGEAEQIAGEFYDRGYADADLFEALVNRVDKALQARDERAAKIAEAYLHVSACDGTGCKVVIAARIRKG